MSDGRSIDPQRAPGMTPSSAGQVRARIEARITAPRGTASRGSGTGNGAPVVAVRGELDMATAEAFDTIVTAVISRYGADLVVDLSGVSFCDAGGLGALVRAANHADLAGGTLSLAGLSPSLRALLRAGDLDRRWPDAPGTPGTRQPTAPAGEALPAAAGRNPAHRRASGARLRAFLGPRHLWMHATLRQATLLEG